MTRPDWKNDNRPIWSPANFNQSMLSPSMPSNIGMKAARSARNSENNESQLIQAFFRAPTDEFSYPHARRDFFVVQQKLVTRELFNCVKIKQQILHQTLKMFLKI